MEALDGLPLALANGIGVVCVAGVTAAASLEGLPWPAITAAAGVMPTVNTREATT